MKSILYVGATLMIGASIYGFVDYKQTSSKKEFKNMYTEEKVTESELAINGKKDVVLKNDVAEKENRVVIKKADEGALTITDAAIIEKTDINIPSNKKNVKVRKPRKFDSRLFSRAPLKEEYIEIKLPEPEKADSKKIEEKIKEN